MTIQEAIKSGRPFRRKGWTHACHFVVRNKDGYSNGELWEYNSETKQLLAVTSLKYVGDIIATDWEVKREPREWWFLADTGGAILGMQTFPPVKLEDPTYPRSGEYVHVREVLP